MIIQKISVDNDFFLIQGVYQCCIFNIFVDIQVFLFKSQKYAKKIAEKREICLIHCFSISKVYLFFVFGVFVGVLLIVLLISAKTVNILRKKIKLNVFQASQVS